MLANVDLLLCRIKTAIAVERGSYGSSKIAVSRCDQCADMMTKWAIFVCCTYHKPRPAMIIAVKK
jgi:hypothetical protein